jgi:hypothetical protein
MSISDLHPQPSPAAVLADVVSMVRDLDATWWTNQSDDDLVATVELVEQARSALAAVQAGAVAEADDRDLGKAKLHYGSTGDWLTHLGGLRKGEGRRVVARAHALTGPLASTRIAMAPAPCHPNKPT